MGKRIDYLIALINEFGRKYGLSDKEAYLYLQKYGAIAIFDACYEYLHTQSFDCAAEELISRLLQKTRRIRGMRLFHALLEKELGNISVIVTEKKAGSRRSQP